MVLRVILESLAGLSLALTVWQWLVARRFPLHRRAGAQPVAPEPGITLLKPLKGCDSATEGCLRSWFAQKYSGQVQILFGVATAQDPVCEVVRRLLAEFPGSDGQLVVCGPLLGTNSKVSKLAQLEPMAKHDILVVSDADVLVPPDLLTNIAALLEPRAATGESQPTPLGEEMEMVEAKGKPSPQPSPVRRERENAPVQGLVTCFYRLANPETMAMKWEAVAINADFWSQVLQSKSLKPLDFALGAVMATRRKPLAEIGGFRALADCLADDYQLGNRIARRGYPILLSPVVVECWAAPMGWLAVWNHQVRWARTIRVCQPLPYFFSILNNATFWPLLLVALEPSAGGLAAAIGCWLVRVAAAWNLQRRIAVDSGTGVSNGSPNGTLGRESVSGLNRLGVLSWRWAWLPLVKDLLQVAVWAMAFAGNTIEWRGERMRLRPDGTLVKGA